MVTQKKDYQLSLSIIFQLLLGVAIYCIGCKNEKVISNPGANSISTSNSFTDIRDSQVYKIIQIGEQFWMSENLRYNAKGSLTNPNYPSKNYGRLYGSVNTDQLCPAGWHLPTDDEWNQMEKVLGLLPTDASKTFWRGSHGTIMKSTSDWKDKANGTNKSGFNALPAGFYYLEKDSITGIFDGLGLSTGYWSDSAKNKTWIRFLGAPKKGVNRMEEIESSTTFFLSCRCIKTID